MLQPISIFFILEQPSYFWYIKHYFLFITYNHPKGLSALESALPPDCPHSISGGLSSYCFFGPSCGRLSLLLSTYPLILPLPLSLSLFGCGRQTFSFSSTWLLLQRNLCTSIKAIILFFRIICSIQVNMWRPGGWHPCRRSYLHSWSQDRSRANKNPKEYVQQDTELGRILQSEH